MKEKILESELEKGGEYRIDVVYFNDEYNPVRDIVVCEYMGLPRHEMFAIFRNTKNNKKYGFPLKDGLIEVKIVDEDIESYLKKQGVNYNDIKTSKGK